MDVVLPAVALPWIYRVHGLTIASEFELPDLAPGAGAPDVMVRRGVVPERLHEPVSVGVLFEASRDHFLIRLDGTARYGQAGGL